jgi:hypothetical protein
MGQAILPAYPPRMRGFNGENLSPVVTGLMTRKELLEV